MLKEFGTDFLKYLPSKLIPALLAFILVPILTYLLKPEEYGLFTLIFTANLLLMTFAGGWLNSSAIRFYFEYKKRNILGVFYSSFYFTTLLQTFLISTLYLLGLLIYSHFYNLDEITVFLLGIAIFISLCLSESFLDLFRVKREIKWYSLFSVTANTVQFVLSISLVIFWGLGVKGVFLGYFIPFAIIVPFMIRELFKGLKISIHNVKRDTIHAFASYGFPLVIANIAWWILNLSDRYLIQFFLGIEAVGIYAANYDIVDKSIRYLIVFFIFVSGPIIINLWETKGEEQTSIFLRDYLKYLTLCTVPLVIFFIVDYTQISAAIISETYHEGANLIPLISLGALCLGFQQFFQYPFVFYKRTRVIFYCTVIATIVNFSLNIWLIPIWGILAAAITTLLANFILFFMMYVYSSKLFKWRIPKRSIVISSTGGIFSAFCLLLILPLISCYIPTHDFIVLIVHFAIFIAIYCAIMLGLKELKITDFKTLIGEIHSK